MCLTLALTDVLCCTVGYVVVMLCLITYGLRKPRKSAKDKTN